MKSLFDDVSKRVSKLTTRAYSTSFSLGIYFIDSRLRNAIYAIYGFVRVADEIVDSFEGYDKKSLLQKFRQETYDAIEKEISVNPILNSFQMAVHQYKISLDLVDTFLQSMEMDLQKQQYTNEKYQQYIVGSAEVVGLMCLHVFTEGDEKLYRELRSYAMKLGAAFQKVNFLRDMNQDYFMLGRTYFPEVDLSRFTDREKEIIESDIQQDFATALKGIRKLPPSSKLAVYLAYVHYLSLFKKIKKLPAGQVMAKRIRISNPRKIGLMINTIIQNKMNLV